MNNLTAALNQLEFVKLTRPSDKAMTLHAEILVAHFEKEEDEAFDADFEAWVDRKEYEESLVYGGAIA
jgi:hypothetical protein